MGQRLLDPSNLAPHDCWRLEQKLVRAFAKTALGSRYGGNPFLYSLCVGRRHVLRKLPMATAATDGVTYFWDPECLRRRNVPEIAITQKHEGYHSALFHHFRGVGKQPWLWNLAADFVSNNMVEQEWREEKGYTFHAHNREEVKFQPLNHPLWKGELGVPLSFEELKQCMIGKGRECIEPERWEAKMRPVDRSVFNRSAESLYHELFRWMDDHNLIIRIAIDNMGWLNIDFGNHMVCRISPEEALQNVLRAASTARSMGSKVPGCVEDFLGELSDPQTTYTDYLDQTISKAKKRGGRRPNYSAYRRRFISQRIYIPTTTDYRPRVLILLDTSASMSQADIAFGISEAQVFDHRAELIVVCVDDHPRWESATKITKSSEVPTVRVVGRGGTVFDEFFAEYRVKLKRYGPFDAIMAITDGGLTPPPIELRPNCDVAWVLTSDMFRFSPNFGKVVKLHREIDPTNWEPFGSHRARSNPQEEPAEGWKAQLVPGGLGPNGSLSNK